MNSSTTNKIKRISGGNLLALSGVFILFTWVSLCFCSFLPFVLFLSFLFNALFMGSSLFSALAQEREKRTIDALRLTQLSSFDILLYKSLGELRSWKVVNGLFIALSAGAAVWAKSPLLWAVGGAVALAAGGLLSIALALGVSTRCDTTSSAVVSGWVTKGAWLVGLPLLDYVLEAVLVFKSDLHFFSYLDPAWVYGTVVSALIFETGALSLMAMLLGAAASVALAYGVLLNSGRLIDASFESAATLDDRSRHSVYSQRFLLGMHKNPFMVRELAWQMRTGAGAWPGYAVFFTLFLAPFLYGLAQQSKVEEHRPVRIVRQSVSEPDSVKVTELFSVSRSEDERQAPRESCNVPIVPRLHGLFCVSRMMGLPVPSHYKFAGHRRIAGGGDRIVVQANGKATTVADHVVRDFDQKGAYRTEKPATPSLRRTHLQTELDRGLLTGLILTLLYLFVRGGAFMSGAVTGEKERRAWDQIALTGVTPETYLAGKLAGVLYFPIRQLLMMSPVLILFALYGGVSLISILLVVPLLLASFLAAASLGLLTSSTQPTSHQAQGTVLTVVATVLLAPMMTGGWLIAGLVSYSLLSKAKLSGLERLFAASSVSLWVGLWGAIASPLAAVMTACNYEGFGVLRLNLTSLPAAVALVVGMVSMAGLSYAAFRLSVRSLDDGGSVTA